MQSPLIYLCIHAHHDTCSGTAYGVSSPVAGPFQTDTTTHEIPTALMKAAKEAAKAATHVEKKQNTAPTTTSVSEIQNMKLSPDSHPSHQATCILVMPQQLRSTISLATNSKTRLYPFGSTIRIPRMRMLHSVRDHWGFALIGIKTG